MSLRLDGLLGPPDAVRLEEHLRTCPPCAAQWAALREADQLLRVAARRPVLPPADFSAHVMRRVAAAPVARPQFWERERLQVQGGRPTVKLSSTGPLAAGPSAIRGHAVAVPAGLRSAPAPRPGLAGVLDHLRPLGNVRIGVYLGGLSAAGAMSMLLIVVFAALWTSGGTAVPTAVQEFVAGNASVAVVRDWLAIAWSLLSDLFFQIDPWLAAAGTLLVAGLGAFWWRVVLAFAGRAGHREVIA